MPKVKHKTPRARKAHDGSRLYQPPSMGIASSRARILVARPPGSQAAPAPIATASTSSVPPDGRILAAAYYDRIFLWDVADPAGLPALARPSASSEKIAIPTSNARASTQLTALWCLAWNTYRYWASRLTANNPTPSTNSMPVATATRTLPGWRPRPLVPATLAG